MTKPNHITEAAIIAQFHNRIIATARTSPVLPTCTDLIHVNNDIMLNELLYPAEGVLNLI